MELIPLLQEKQIGIINASPFSMGLLTQNGAPDWHPAPPAIKAATTRAAEYCNAKGMNLAKLALQYSTSERRIATTLVGAANVGHIIKNVRWLEESMDEDLRLEVLQILVPVKNQTWPSGRPENSLC